MATIGSSTDPQDKMFEHEKDRNQSAGELKYAVQEMEKITTEHPDYMGVDLEELLVAKIESVKDAPWYKDADISTGQTPAQSPAKRQGIPGQDGQPTPAVPGLKQADDAGSPMVDDDEPHGATRALFPLFMNQAAKEMEGAD